ncbi:MFS transporter [Clostridium sp. D2Q-11]|uniref:MFS transporter n=1 Tax=Anaeromonas frigoriresistens TaxID=2683708 RepID=A0A942UV19_9FIRM|nr:MFS transporter [Anaeromonas frigoriresistens]MBS4539113.1 MFS transporter [Anaeromonas frigoriresistens]
MEYNNKLLNNIKNNYIFTFLARLDLTQGIWMIYLATQGMSLFQLGILEGIFHVTSFFMEVPTGVIADIYSRKVSRLLGRVAALIGVLILLFSNSFYLYALSFVFIALSYNLESGAGDALIYDSLKELNNENKYMKISGNKELFFQMGSFIAFIAGGYIATRSYKIAFIITAVITMITIIQSFFFTEPNIEYSFNKKLNIFSSMKNQIVESTKIIKGNKKIGFLIIFVQLIGAFATSMFYYLQNYLKGNGYTEFHIGILFAISSLFAAIIGSKTYLLESKIKERGILLIMPIIAIVSIWGIALTKYYFIYYIILVIVESIIYIATNDYINKLIPSESRATILSVTSMIFSLFMITIFPIIGRIGDVYSLKLAFKLLGVLGSILVIINTYVMIIIKRKEKINGC